MSESDTENIISHLIQSILYYEGGQPGTDNCESGIEGTGNFQFISLNSLNFNFYYYFI